MLLISSSVEKTRDASRFRRALRAAPVTLCRRPALYERVVLPPDERTDPRRLWMLAPDDLDAAVLFPAAGELNRPSRGFTAGELSRRTARCGLSR
jgi:hypothetical protein